VHLLQGTASGKCGVTFSAETCGDSVGESGYQELQKQVQGLETQAKENSKVVNAIAGLILGYGYGGYGAYKQASGKALAQPPSKIGAITVDNVLDIPDEGEMTSLCRNSVLIQCASQRISVRNSK
jgi:hypothetical protein